MRIKRHKNPEQVKRALLDSAAALAAKEGFDNISLQKIATLAGVTKGGLLHHFPNKHILLDALYEEMVAQIDSEIDVLLVDDDAYGCFTRAYISIMLSEIEIKTRPPSVTLSMIMDENLADKWANWLDRRLEGHKKTDSGHWLEMIRYAADGLWLSSISRPLKDTGKIGKKLIKATYEEGNI